MGHVPARPLGLQRDRRPPTLASLAADRLTYQYRELFNCPAAMNELGYAQVVVKLQTHRVKAISNSDVALARAIEQAAMWKPEAGSPLTGFPKTWVK